MPPRAVFVSTLLALVASTLPLSAAPRIEDGEIRLDAPILFAPGTAELRAESEAPLAELKEFLAQKPALTLVRIEGHVSGAGAEEKNQKLSEARALAVGRWLIAHGVECSRLCAVGFGGTKPAGDPSTPEGRARNTRIVVAPAALRGRAIGGAPADGGGHPAGELCQP